MKLRVGERVVVDEDGRRVEFTDLQQALLLLVADAEAGVSRQRIATVLWSDDSGATSPRRRLRQIVYAVNRRARAPLLTGDQARMALRAEVEVIWTGQDAGASVESPSAAWTRLRDDIQDRARTRSRAHVASAVDSARLNDDPGAILELVATDAQPESMWRDAVWALLRAGRVREAEASFGELGIDDPQVVRRCRDAMARLASGHAPGPVPHAADGPVVGRADVLGATISALERGDRRVVLAGPSGVGLSRTLGATSAWVVAEKDDLVVASTRCSHAGKSVAYDTLNRLFDSELFKAAHQEVEEPWRSILARVLRVYGRTPEREIEPLEGTSATLRVLHAVSALILKALGSATLMAVVDDLHLADSGSLTVLTHLGVDGEGAVIRLLGTCRNDIDLDGATRALLERAESTVLEVPPLDGPASEAMLQALRPELTPENSRALAGLCGGYPQRLADLAQSVEGDGSELTGATLDQLLHARLAVLDEHAQDVAALLSIRPDGLDAETLMRTCGIGTLALSRATRRLIDLGIVEDDVRVRIWSSFLRRGIRASIPDSIRRALHLRVASALRLRDPPPAGDIGRHLEQAGDHEQARIWLARGASEAAEAEAFPVAIELAELAVRVAPGEPELHETLGDLLTSEGRFREASLHLGAAVDLSERAADSTHHLELRLRWVRALSEHVFDSEEVGARARAVLEDARAHGHLDLEARAIDLLFRIGDYCLDFDLVYEALDYLLEARSREEQSPYLDWVEVRRCYIDDPKAARKAAWRFFNWTEPGSGDRLMAVARLIGQGVGRGVVGDEDVQLGVSELSEFGESGPSRFRVAALSNLGVWHLDHRRLEDAEAALREALEAVRDVSGTQIGIILSNLLEISMWRGDLSETEALLGSRTFSQGNNTPIDQMAVDACRAWVALESGQVGAAARLLRSWSTVETHAPVSFFPEILALARARLSRARRNADGANGEIRLLIARCAALGMTSPAERLTSSIR